MFHCGEARQKLRGVLLTLALCAACRFGEHHAQPPLDGAPPDGKADASPDAEQNVFHGMHAVIGDTPQWTGSCSALAGYTMMSSHFAQPMQEADIDAGWDFDTSADSYTDPSYGFDPMWPSSAPGQRFSVRYRATMRLAAGHHCFSIDIGATGTDIITSGNQCGQIYVGVAGATPDTAIAETGYEAATSGPAIGCVDVPASAAVETTAPDGSVTRGGGAELDVVYWYFNIFQQAVLHVRHCAGDGCTPADPLTVTALVPL